jgi:hypothetical protein
METLIFLAALVMLVAPADAKDRYNSGQFPQGRFYHERELLYLADRPVAERSYLVGRFVYMGQRNGVDVFSSFTQNANQIVFGKILIAVRFFNNRPPTLAIGKMILPNESDPLTINSVKLSGDFLLVQTDSLTY